LASKSTGDARLERLYRGGGHVSREGRDHPVTVGSGAGATGRELVEPIQTEIIHQRQQPLDPDVLAASIAWMSP
jgi:hypothetical protein